MIKLFLSVTLTLATAFMGLVACEPTSTSSTTVRGTNEATQTPTPTTESTSTVTRTNEATQTPTVTTQSISTVTGTSEATQTPTVTTQSTGTVRGTNEATQTPITTTESTGTVTGTNEAPEPPAETMESSGTIMGTNEAPETPVTAESTGTVTDYAPGEDLILKTDAAEPLRYKFGETVIYMTSDGRVIDASKVRRDSKVRVHYFQDGDAMVIDKVIVMDVRD